MKNIIPPGLLLCFCTITLISCQDIIEVNLAKKNVTVLAPATNSILSSSSITFWWDEIKGANSYKLQIVKPDFSSIQSLIVDTSITTNKFIFTLGAGTYQWRVRAENSSSYTEYVVSNLAIDSSLDLTNQWVVLTSPVNNDSSAAAAQSFVWQPLNNANSYLFQILQSGTSIYSQTITSNSINYTFSTSGTYEWRVLAQNSISTSSALNSTRTIVVDLIAPTTPILSLPLTNDTVSNPVNLTWTKDISASYDSVLVYSDSALTTQVASSKETSPSFAFTGTVNQNYFWRVRSFDAVGNRSSYSAQRKFKIIH